MTEFSFLATWNDTWVILDSILEKEEYILIPDLRYDTPSPVYVTALSESVKSELKVIRHAYLWGKRFSLFPPVLQRIAEGVNAGKYFVELSSGGPGLELTIPPCYEDGGTLNLGPGMLSLPRRWLNPETNIWQKPTEEVKNGFADVKRGIKRHLARHPDHPQIWSGPEALKLLKTNKARISGFESKREKGGT